MLFISGISLSFPETPSLPELSCTPTFDWLSSRIATEQSSCHFKASLPWIDPHFLEARSPILFALSFGWNHYLMSYNRVQYMLRGSYMTNGIFLLSVHMIAFYMVILMYIEKIPNLDTVLLSLVFSSVDQKMVPAQSLKPCKLPLFSSPRSM